jgi:hypothetical protein
MAGAGRHATLAALGAAALGLTTGGPAHAYSVARGSAKLRHALLSSRELWATIDVCHPADQAHTVGIRGSMPGDGRSHDKMYMSFRLQYQDATTGKWIDLDGASSKFLAVGGAGTPRQDGLGFELTPAKAKFMLRGVVEFQWRHGTTVLESATRPTTAGHRSLAGADPSGYSAATCAIG